MMRRHNIDMWIIVNEEFHDDPLTQYIAPPRPYTGNRDIFLFIDTGKSLRKIAVTGYAEENVQRFFESENDPKPADQVLPALYTQYHPVHIGLSMSGQRGVERSITHDSYLYLAKTMGPGRSAPCVNPLRGILSPIFRVITEGLRWLTMGTPEETCA